jgi:hypothetical protein
MLDTIRDQEKDIKLFEAVILSLISEKELKKIVDKCRWNDDDMEWIVPCDTAKIANKIMNNKGVDNNSYSNMATSAYSSNATTGSSLLTLPASSSNSSLPQISSNRSNSMLPQLEMHSNSNSRSKLPDLSRGNNSSDRLPTLGGNKSNERIDLSGGFVGEDSVIAGVRFEDIMSNKAGYDEYKPNMDMMKVVQFGNDGMGVEKKKKKKKKKKPELLTNISDEAGTGDRAGSLNEWGFAYDGAIAAETGDYNSDEEYDQDFDEDLSDYETTNNKNVKMPQIPSTKASSNQRKSPRAKLPLL